MTIVLTMDISHIRMQMLGPFLPYLPQPQFHIRMISIAFSNDLVPALENFKFQIAIMHVSYVIDLSFFDTFLDETVKVLMQTYSSV